MDPERQSGRGDRDAQAFYAGFLGHLRREGLSIGVDDHLATFEILRAEHEWTHAQVRTALRSLVVRDPEEEETYERVFALWFGRQDPTLTAPLRPAGPRQGGADAPATHGSTDQDLGGTPTPARPRLRRWMAFGLFSALLVAVGWFGFSAGPEQPPAVGPLTGPPMVTSPGTPDLAEPTATTEPTESDEPTGPSPVPVDPTVADALEADVPTLPAGVEEPLGLPASTGRVEITGSHEVPMVLNQPPRWGPERSGSLQYGGLRGRGGLVAMGAIALASLLLLVVFPLRRTLVSWVGARSPPVGPLLFRFRPRIGALPQILNAQQVEDLAASLGAAATTALSRTLDIPASIRATSASAGAPHLHHRLRTTPRRYVFALQDDRRISSLTRVVEGIAVQLVEAGVDLEILRFDQDPRALRDDRGRRTLAALVEGGLDGLLLVGAPDAALDAAAESPAAWVRQLPGALHTVWLVPSGCPPQNIGRQLLDTAGIDVRDEPLSAVSGLGSFSISPPALRPLADDISRFRCAAAWLPEWTPVSLEWLADSFFLGQPPALRARLIGATAPDEAELVTLREDCPPALARRVRVALLRELDRGRPAAGTGADVRWRTHRAGLLAWDVPELAEGELLDLAADEPWVGRLAAASPGLSRAEESGAKELQPAARHLRDPARLSFAARGLLGSVLIALGVLAVLGLRWWAVPPPDTGHRWDLHAGGPGIAAFRADGRLVATASYRGYLRVWEPASGDLLASTVADGTPTAVALSADGALLALGTAEGVLELFTQSDMDAISSQSLLGSRTVPEAGDVVAHLAFSPDGWTLAAGTEAGRMVLVDTITGVRRADVQLEAPIVDMLWDPDSEGMVIGTKYGRVLGMDTSGVVEEVVQLPGPIHELSEVRPGAEFVASRADSDYWHIFDHDGSSLGEGTGRYASVVPLEGGGWEFVLSRADGRPGRMVRTRIGTGNDGRGEVLPAGALVETSALRAGPAKRWAALSSTGPSGRIVRVSDGPDPERAGGLVTLDLGGAFGPSEPLNMIEVWVDEVDGETRLSVVRDSSGAPQELRYPASDCLATTFVDADRLALREQHWDSETSQPEAPLPDVVVQRRLGGMLATAGAAPDSTVRLHAQEGLDFGLLLGLMRGARDASAERPLLELSSPEPPRCESEPIEITTYERQLLSLCGRSSAGIRARFDIYGGRIVGTDLTAKTHDLECISDLARWVRPAARASKTVVAVELPDVRADRTFRGLPLELWRRIGRHLDSDTASNVVEWGRRLLDEPAVRQALPGSPAAIPASTEPTVLAMDGLLAALADPDSLFPRTGDGVILADGSPAIFVGPGPASVLVNSGGALTLARLTQLLDTPTGASALETRLGLVEEAQLAPPSAAWIYYGAITGKGPAWVGRNLSGSDPLREPRVGDVVQLEGPRLGYSGPLEFEAGDGGIRSPQVGAFADGAKLEVAGRKDWRWDDLNVWLLVSPAAERGETADAHAGPDKEGPVRSAVTTGPAEIIGSPDGLDAIHNTMKRYWGRIRMCHDRELKGDPDLAGKVTVSFLVDTSGNPSDVEVVENTTGSASVGACITREVKRIRFSPPPEDDVQVAGYPFVLKSR